MVSVFEGERARGRVLARDRPGPGHRDRAVCSPGGTSELGNHDHAGKVGAREYICLSGIKLHFQHLLIHSFLSISQRP